MGIFSHVMVAANDCPAGWNRMSPAMAPDPVNGLFALA
jgi:hypothetical protein